MYPDDFIKTWYLIPRDYLSYDERRKIFEQMITACQFLCSDIGHGDMLIQFDDERKLVQAETILTDSKIEWQER
jgi:hypothetical protein